jgi:hypothetical protein
MVERLDLIIAVRIKNSKPYMLATCMYVSIRQTSADKVVSVVPKRFLKCHLNKTDTYLRARA